MGTWHGEPDEAAARLIAEHGMVAGMNGDDLMIEAGSEALLPPWPPVHQVEVQFPNGQIVEVRRLPVTLCAVCATPVKLYGDAGWRHELGYRETGGCSTPWPEG